MIAVIIAIFLVLPLAFVGACSVWGGINTVLQPHGGEGLWIVFAIVGAVAIPAFIGLAYLVAKLWRG